MKSDRAAAALKSGMLFWRLARHFSDDFDSVVAITARGLSNTRSLHYLEHDTSSGYLWVPADLSMGIPAGYGFGCTRIRVPMD